MDSKMNYYELLGVCNTASKEEIQKAYKTQMKKWHPDINKSTEAPKMAVKLNEAKLILLDDEKRREYDISLEQDINESYNKYTGKEQTNNQYQMFIQKVMIMMTIWLLNGSIWKNIWNLVMTVF